MVKPDEHALAGIAVEKPGLYLLVGDVVETLQAMADASEIEEHRRAYRYAADRFAEYEIA